MGSISPIPSDGAQHGLSSKSKASSRFLNYIDIFAVSTEMRTARGLPSLIAGLNFHRFGINRALVQALIQRARNLDFAYVALLIHLHFQQAGALDSVFVV